MADLTKSWFASKTIWSDILTILVAAYTGALQVFPSLPSVNTGILATVLAILGGFGIYARTAATTQIK